MKKRYRLIRRGERNTFYCFDIETQKRTSLETFDRDEAERIIEAKNDSLRQPALNLNIARAYLSGTVVLYSFLSPLSLSLYESRHANRATRG